MWQPSSAILQLVKDNAKQLLPDALFLSLLHRKHIGRFPRLLRPTTFNEKILQRSLRPDPRYAALTDKLTVRDYVKAKVGEQHLVPLISSPDVFTQSVFDALPNAFVMKANHGSSFVEIVQDKSKVTFDGLRTMANRWMSTDFYLIARERHYRQIRPRIFFEELLLDEHRQIPADYKVHCFGGKSGRPMMYIVVISDRFGNNTHGDVFDVHWNHLDVGIGPYARSTTPPPPPENLNSILDMAAVLAEDFNYVRVDLYAPGNAVYFGELTFTPGAGVVPMRPDRVDFEWGRLLT
ncbi:ATP-grasp fold amidoligase family protein [Paraburkholderia strydomiana]|uniref:ATP-grasp fold amidoligase family protein n=1 Tax=Paraburkholderia strydomiana TaxID=1245417 RepID=UPI00285C1EFC|nr:ATP-grasp fold amidoligase family protein [Paraburkholderia strydomiana]MDR7003254.1 hypothetical protein [Paraburkholderia strydomiana]